MSEPHSASPDNLLDETKRFAQSKLNEQKDGTAQNLAGLAESLRRAPREGGAFDAFAQSAATGLDRMAGALRSKDVSQMVRELEGFARRQPAAFMGLALAAGFIATRFAKAGNPAGTPSTPPSRA